MARRPRHYEEKRKAGMKIEVVIKKITEKEINSIYPYYKKWIMDLFPEFSMTTRKKIAEKLYGEKYIYKLINENGIVLVASLGKKPVGIFLADPSSDGLSYASWLMVDSYLQGKGVGKSLLRKWEEEAKKQKCHNLRVEADHRNVGFFEKAGFRLIGVEQKGYFGTDNYLFQKIIAEFKEENI
jgi:ribosomal protein S18 acetylase RimI-like enzyme